MKYLYNDIRYAISIEEIISIKEIALSKLQQNFSNYIAPQSYYISDKNPKLLSFLKLR